MQLPIVAVADLISGRFWHFFSTVLHFYLTFRISFVCVLQRSFQPCVCVLQRSFVFQTRTYRFFLPNDLPLYSVVRPMQVFGLLFCRYILNVIYPKIIRLPSANFSASRIACQTSCCLLRTRNRNERNSWTLQRCQALSTLHRYPLPQIRRLR